jgi:hypothetical protein
MMSTTAARCPVVADRGWPNTTTRYCSKNFFTQKGKIDLDQARDNFKFARHFFPNQGFGADDPCTDELNRFIALLKKERSAFGKRIFPKILGKVLDYAQNIFEWRMADGALPHSVNDLVTIACAEDELSHTKKQQIYWLMYGLFRHDDQGWLATAVLADMEAENVAYLDPNDTSNHHYADGCYLSAAKATREEPINKKFKHALRKKYGMSIADSMLDRDKKFNFVRLDGTHGYVKTLRDSNNSTYVAYLSPHAQNSDSECDQKAIFEAFLREKGIDKSQAIRWLEEGQC